MSEPTSSITGILGGQTIGCFLMLVLQGISISSLTHYLRTYKREPYHRYILVLPLFTVSAVQSILVLVFTYRLVVIGWGSLDSIVQHDWVIDSQPIWTAVCMTGAQGFYAHRLYLLVGRRWLGILYCVCLPVVFAIQVLITVIGFDAPHFDNVFTMNVSEVGEYEDKWKPVFIVSSIMNVGIDVSVTFGMLYTLHRARNTTDTATQSVINKLLLLIVETMALPTICQILTTTFHALYGDINSIERMSSYCQSPLCVISLLTTLLARKGLRRIINSDAESLPDIPLTEKSDATHRRRREPHVNSVADAAGGLRATVPADQRSSSGDRSATDPPGILRDWQSGDVSSVRHFEQGIPWDRAIISSRRAVPPSTERGAFKGGRGRAASLTESGMESLTFREIQPFGTDVQRSARAIWGESPNPGAEEEKPINVHLDGGGGSYPPSLEVGNLGPKHQPDPDDLSIKRIRAMTRRREAE